MSFARRESIILLIMEIHKISMSFLLLLSIMGIVQGGFGLLGGKMLLLPTELACEGYPIVLRCPGTDVIKVVSSEYGRQNDETCYTSAERMQNTDCRLPEAKDIIASKCNNITQCKLTVSDETFPDPCPNTHKYLKVTFKCVKYMFGCPGTLTSIGSNTTFTTSIRPEGGSWTKDPIYNPNHVFYAAKSQQSIQEYRSNEEFADGDPMLHDYELPSRMHGTSFVVYDSYVYYIKAQSRRIVKYSLIHRLRMREGSVPGQNNHLNDRTKNEIEIAIDEEGLWVIYTSLSDSGKMVISKMNKDTLVDEKTWRTSYRKSSALYSFVICGVVYVVGSRTGEVEYMYNTNAKSMNGRSVTIRFERNRPFSPSDPLGLHSPQGITPKRLFAPPVGLRGASSRSFLNYNFSSVKYNPRDRLLYAWDATNSKATYYNLHFGLPNPVDADKPPTTTSMLTTTTPTPTTTTADPSRNPPFPSEEAAPSVSTHSSTSRKVTSPENQQFCSVTIRSGIRWPVTSGGRTAHAPCPGNNKGQAKWKCVMSSSNQQPFWGEEGPDMTSCSNWIEELETSLKTGAIDSITAADLLSDDLSTDKATTSGQLKDAASLIMTIVTNAQKSDMSLEQTQRFTDNLLTIVQYLTSTSTEKLWEEMNDNQRHASINNIFVAMENAGSILATSLAESSPVLTTEQTLIKPGVAMEVGLQKIGSSSSFQLSLQEEQAALSSQDLNDHSLKGFGSVVFIVYDHIGEYAHAQLEDSPNEDSSEQWQIDSRVVSASLGSSSRHVQLQSPVIITLANQQDSSASRKCVYWDYSQKENVSHWSTEGCHVVQSNSTHTQCSCNHMTNFAVLVNVAGITLPTKEDAIALSIVSSVGVSISLFCLLLCIITFSVFRNLQNDRNTIHKHLCLSLFVAEAVFLFGINQTLHALPCAIIAGILHYTFLAAFMWMALEGFQLYVMLVEVFEGRSRWKWYYLVGYGVPAVIVGVSAIINSKGYGGSKVCWLKLDSSFIWSFVGPICAVILCNLVFIAITIVKMYRHTLTYTDASKINSLKAALRGASVLLCLLGITWAFGLLWVWGGTPVMAYLFCLFNAFQGLFIFVFHCLFQKKVRNEYHRYFSRFSCCHKRAPEAYVSNSMSFSKQYTPARYSGSTRNSTSAGQPANSQLRRMWNETLVGASPTDSTTLPGQDPSIANRDQARVLRDSRQNSLPPNSSTGRLTDERAMKQRNSGGNGVEDEVFLPSHANPKASGLSNQSSDESYDRLQRHCHPNGCSYEQHQPMCRGSKMERDNIHHSTVRHSAPPNRPQPQPRSHTINHMKTATCGMRGPDKEDVSLLRREDLHRASTLSNAAAISGQEWERRPPTPTRRFSQPIRPAIDESGRCYQRQESNRSEERYLMPMVPSSCYRKCNEGAAIRDSRLQQGPESHILHRRRSLTSSESDDPVVNDFSAGSTTGSSCGKPPSYSGPINNRSQPCDTPNNHMDYASNARSSDHYCRDASFSGVYGDEADLEVQRLTGPESRGCDEKCEHGNSCGNDSQRDSAFYQSMPDLDCSPVVNFSSNSSGCSPETTNRDGLYHQHIPSRAYEPKTSRYTNVVSSHPEGVCKTGYTDELNKEAHLEEGASQNRKQFNRVDTGYYGDHHSDSGDYPHPPISQIRNFDDKYDVRTDSNPRMMTCL